MFSGSYLYSLDSKKRLSIPAKLRRNLQPESKDSFKITQGFGKCLDLYPIDEWLEIEKRLSQLSEYDFDQVKLRRMILHTAMDVEMDNQARIILPQPLLQFAGIEGEVLILGNLRKMELWNPKIFEDYLNVSPEAYEQLAAKVMMGK
jgi:MraZ protein